jgi:pentatricopeptide repeat protein
MIQFSITPDDVSYSSLIEALLEDGYMEDAYEFYIQVSNFSFFEQRLT